MNKYGLVGRNISYSFSRGYFREKFEKEGIAAVYLNFDLQDLDELPEILEKDPTIRGLNVTIPYKEAILPYLEELDPVAAAIGAVNTLRIDRDKKLWGFNTDHLGFSQALEPHLTKEHNKALILGTGGASKAVAFALKERGIEYCFVSRSPGNNAVSYDQLDDLLVRKYKLIINCTPLGTFPKTTEYPPLPFPALSRDHLVFDLIYNPPVTRLMELSRLQGATVLNGLRMLEFQAEAAWKIWNS